MVQYLEHILLRFLPDDGFTSIAPYGNGHINDTYLVETAGGQSYILQRINHRIFTDVDGMMENIIQVTSHLKSKLIHMPGHDADRETLCLVNTLDDGPFFKDDGGDFWRVFIFISGMKVLDIAPHNEIAKEAGRIIGLFHHLLSDFKGTMKDTLPGFHSIHRREGEFRAALVSDPKERLLGAREDILFVEYHMEAMRRYFNAFEKRAFPNRIVHYDTKLNNILFDQNDRAMCLIDLDTVCPGYVHFDYGDALRTLANKALEDEKDLAKVEVNQSYYRSFTDGYLSQADVFLSEEEKKLLPFAPIYLTFLIGLRFLTDYLNGDTYYKVKYPEHNLVRARVQFKLVQEFSKVHNA